MMDSESESIDAKLRKLEERQSMYRQRQMKEMDSEILMYNQDISPALRELIDMIKESEEDDSTDVFQRAVGAISKETSEIALNVQQASFRSESLCKAFAKLRKMQWEDLQIMEESSHERESSIISNSAIATDIQEQSSVLSKVKERLRSIQQSRAESQFDLETE